MNLSSVTVIVPAYNEEATVAEVIRRVRSRQPLDVELIVVDDGSTDGTAAAVSSVIELVDVFIRQPSNQGKGTAIRAALARATGDIIVFQDADLELDPAIIPTLVEPLRNGRAELVAGSRMNEWNRPRMTRRQWMVNRVLTAASRVLLGVRMEDLETCAKAFPRRLLLDLELESTGFELEPEIVAKMARVGVRIEEFPIEFHPRSRAEGKKIRACDALWAVTAMMRHRSWQPTSAALLRPALAPPTAEAAVPQPPYALSVAS